MMTASRDGTRYAEDECMNGRTAHHHYAWSCSRDVALHEAVHAPSFSFDNSLTRIRHMTLPSQWLYGTDSQCC
jgi:hypothetical protein